MEHAGREHLTSALEQAAGLLVPGLADGLTVALGEGAAARVALTARAAPGGQVEVLPDGGAPLDPGDTTVVALQARGRVLGALHLHRARGRAPLDAAALATADRVAGLCALALASAELAGTLEAFLRTAPVGLSLTDADERYLVVNDRLAEIDGTPVTDHLGRRVEHVLGPELGAASARLRRQVRTTGEPLVDEHLHATGPDGRRRDFQASYVPVPLVDGTVGCGGAMADVTEQRRAQDALRDSEARLRTLVTTAPDAILGIDAAGRIVEANPSIEGVLGYRPEELLGRQVEELVPTRFRAAHEDLRAGYAARPTTRPMGAGRDLFARHRDGHDVPVEVSLGSMQTDAGQFTTAVVVDVSARKRAEAALRASEERFRAAFEHAPIGVALTSAHRPWAVVQANPALGELLGAPAEHVVGLPLLALLHPDDVGPAYGALERLLGGHAPRVAFEARLLRVGDEDAWVGVSASAAIAHDGEPGHLVLQVQDVSERKRFERRLRHLADHDPLTGLFNRRRFEEELARAVAVAGRTRQPAALLSVDLDGFKAVNDTHGHAAGDRLLVRVAETLRGRLRKSDVIGRLGGDEFAILMPATDELGAALVAEELAGELEHACAQGEDGPVRAGASIGVAVTARDGTPDPGDLLVQADLAMYDAKARRQDRAAPRRDRLRARARWTERLRHALDHDGLVLLAQPILDLARDRVDRHELLLRLREDDGELVAPGAFLPAAEDSGLIRDVDVWVVSRAVELLAAQGPVGRDVLEVNLSGASLSDRRTVDAIVAAVRDAPVDPARLVLEVTETAAIADMGRARDGAARLTALGCGFALDDFGSGFSSLLYLKHLPFDTLKIDGEFVRELPESRRDRHTVQAIVDLARGLGTTTVAEYVEDAETLELLRALGVDFAQGFHVGRPQPLADGRVPRTGRFAREAPAARASGV